VEVERPFERVGGGESVGGLEITPEFEPYRHQAEAWRRSSSREGAPANTLVSTGSSATRGQDSAGLGAGAVGVTGTPGDRDAYLRVVQSACGRAAGVPEGLGGVEVPAVPV
jgi:hypothetical protein